MIKICKILKRIYNADDYYIFSAYCGEHLTVIYKGKEPPKPLKTVEYQVTGEYQYSKSYGKQLLISEYKKVGKIKIYKPEKYQGLSQSPY